ncbi:MAG: ASKHA domain-containing protein [Chloroflexi bacterium]|nr:ASKHA domain-containing protein [Chloroflexota bacterium]MCL5076107.1 ASKHA domain-containing protein [Chloroflexota bacterium]
MSDVARLAGIDLATPCGGEGRCGRCKVRIEMGEVATRQTPHLTTNEAEQGIVLACQTVVKGDTIIFVEPRPVTAPQVEIWTTAERIALPIKCEWRHNPRIRKIYLEMEPPSLADNTNDFDRLRQALTHQEQIKQLGADLPILRIIAHTLRAADWRVTAVLEMPGLELNDNENLFPPDERGARLIGLLPGNRSGNSLGVAVDIGTTTIVIYLVDLISGKVLDTASAYNAQISCGEDIISRIIYAQRGDGLSHLQRLAIKTINELLTELAGRNRLQLGEINEMIVAGNTTMIHLFLGIPPRYIREEPYIPTITHPPAVTAGELGITINPHASIQCMPAVGSYVGGDITAGVISSGLFQSERLSLFIDIGTNGEIVLGNADWLATCACSAGPAFEGGGVRHGMRASSGAIDEIWINGRTYEPTYRVIGNVPPRGICGSGLISALAEMFITGIVDKGGRLQRELNTPRVRIGEYGPEYVIAWAPETAHTQDIVLTETDINNLIRAKGAIYAGFSILLRYVGLNMEDVKEILIGGAFGQHLNVEKAIQIGLLPDVPWDKFKYLGNTSILGAYTALLCRDMRKVVSDVARRMTYLELSANNAFMDEYTSCLFLPHTNIEAFPSVERLLRERGQSLVAGKY